MSEPLMDLWDYRQAQYAEAAKWVCGDIGHEHSTPGPKTNARETTLPEGATHWSAASPHRDLHWLARTPRSMAHIPYRLHSPGRSTEHRR